MAPSAASTPPRPGPGRASVQEHVGRLRGVLSAALQDPDGALTETRAVVEPGLVGRVAAADVDAPVGLPGFDNSQMDGFAVRLADLHGAESPTGSGPSLPLAGVVPAGRPAPELPAGAALAVMTGAPIPDGADCVIPVERTLAGSFAGILPVPADDDGAQGSSARVTFDGLTAEDLESGRFIRPAGSDVRAGERMLSAGDVLTPAALGLLAALGLPDVQVRQRLRALVLSTGDEVREPGTRLGPGQLHDANTPLLIAGLESLGAEVRAASAVTDDVEEFTDRLDALLAQHTPQLLVTAGGISAGAFEVVRQSLGRRGVEFGAVAQQPGGPQGWGLLPGPEGRPSVAVICLPGNPVSCAVSLETLVRPALAAVDLGCPAPRRLRVRLAEPADSKPGTTQYRRAAFTEPEPPPAGGDQLNAPPPAVRLVGGPSSHLLGHLARADVLVELPEGDTHVEAGAERDALLLTGRSLP